MRLRIVLLGVLAAVAACTSNPTATSSPTGTPAASPPPTSQASSAAPSPTTLPTPVTGTCPAPPADASPVPAPFGVGPGYAISLGEGGIDQPPPGVVSLSDWNVAGPGGCIASVLAFQFASAELAAGFTRQQAESIGLVAEPIDGANVWFSASGDAARLALGSVALSVSVNEPDPVVARDLVRSIVDATQ